jgi:hypothetical protein
VHLRLIGNSLVMTGVKGLGRGGALGCWSKDVEFNRVYASRNTISAQAGSASGAGLYIDNSFFRMTASILEHNVGSGIDHWYGHVSLGIPI